jgi:DNA polymerase III epsilon subunit-like protein
MEHLTKDLNRTICVDIETSGLSDKCGILSIGAVNMSDNEDFYMEARLEFGHEIGATALAVNGFSREECYDREKTNQSGIVKAFYKWVESQSYKTGKKAIIAGHNIMFDIGFLKRVKDSWPFIYRNVDCHGVGLIVLGESHSSESLCDALRVDREPKVHNALEGAKMAKRCLLALYKLTSRI